MTRKHARSAIALGLVSVGLLVPAAASAETVEIGQPAPAGSGGGTCASCTMYQLATDPTSPSYAVPAGSWTVTAWSIRGGTTTPGNARLRIFRPTGSPDQFRLVAESADAPVPLNVVTTTPVSIPVQAGDRIGLRSGDVPGDVLHQYAGAVNDDARFPIGDPMLNQTVGPDGDFPAAILLAAQRLNIGVTLFRADPSTNPGPTPTKKKCKKKKPKKKSAGAAKKKCKKKKKK
jgi:hypothetical protein